MLSDLGCHRMDLAHWALDLRHPETISAVGPPVDAVGAPSSLKVTYRYPARNQQPPVTLTWYHGSERPALLANYKDLQGNPIKFGDGVLFIGKEGAIYGDYGRLLLCQKKNLHRCVLGFLRNNESQTQSDITRNGSMPVRQAAALPATSITVER